MSKSSNSHSVYKVDLTKQAEKDIKKIVRFITKREGPDTGQAILDEFIKAKNGLNKLPDRGRIPPEFERINVTAYRECQVPPYRMVYEVSETDRVVYVHLVVDGRRNLPEILEARLLAPNSSAEE